MNIAPYLELLAKWKEDILAESGGAEWKPPKQGYFPSSEIETNNETAKVIRLDVVVVAMHVTTAKVLQRSIAGVIATGLNKVVNSLIQQAVRIFIKQALSSTVASTAKWLMIFGQTFAESMVQMEAERSIRRASKLSIMDTFNQTLSKEKNERRRRKWVTTRHWSKKQRRENGHAHKHYPVGKRVH